MQEEILIYVQFFRKELNREHPLSIRGGYCREAAYMIGIMLRIDDMLFNEYEQSVEELFAKWNGCLICKAKMMVFLNIQYQNRNNPKQNTYLAQYQKLQSAYDARDNYKRNFREEVYQYMEKYATEAFLISPKADISP